MLVHRALTDIPFDKSAMIGYVRNIASNKRTEMRRMLEIFGHMSDEYANERDADA